jgi:hypothetical protein
MYSYCIPFKESINISKFLFSYTDLFYSYIDKALRLLFVLGLHDMLSTIALLEWSTFSLLSGFFGIKGPQVNAC